MKRIHLKIANGETDDLLARLTGHVFHLTSGTNLSSIRKAKRILNSKDGGLESNCSSGNSFARAMGYVSLFDLRDQRENRLSDILSDYNFLGPSWFQKEQGTWYVSQLAYFVLQSTYHDRIVPNEAARGSSHKYIPHGEVWIAGEIPLDWIQSVLLVTRRDQITPINTLSGMVERAVRTLYRDRKSQT